MVCFPTSKWFVVAMVAFASFQTGNCLQCYEGNQTTVTNITCEGSCRNLTISGGEIESAEYSCCPEKRPTNCSSSEEDEVTTTICYCNEDLCNGSGVATIVLPFFLGSLLFKMFL